MHMESWIVAGNFSPNSFTLLLQMQCQHDTPQLLVADYKRFIDRRNLACQKH